jgi:hypothetical protein
MVTPAVLTLPVALPEASALWVSTVAQVDLAAVVLLAVARIVVAQASVPVVAVVPQYPLALE